jgi:hypothetical protein
MLILHVLLHPSNSGHELLKIQGNEVTEILSSDSEDKVEVGSGLEHFSDTMFPECNPTDLQDNAVASRVVYNGDPVSVTRTSANREVQVQYL